MRRSTTPGKRPALESIGNQRELESEFWYCRYLLGSTENETSDNQSNVALNDAHKSHDGTLQNENVSALLPSISGKRGRRTQESVMMVIQTEGRILVSIKLEGISNKA